MNDKIKFDKAYILYGTENYFPIIECTIISIRKFSRLPIIVYSINKKFETTQADVYCEVMYNLHLKQGINDNLYKKNDNDSNFYIKRENSLIYSILIQKPFITIHALENYANKVFFIDADSIVFNNIEDLFDLYPENEEVPYFTKGIYEVLTYNNYGHGEGLENTIERPLCELLNIDQSFRLKTHYRQSGYYISGQNTIPFLNEWYLTCGLDTIFKEHWLYAPYNEETVLNCLLWKYKISKGFPLIYVNGSLDRLDIINDDKNYIGKENELDSWFMLPPNKNYVYFIHGEKRPNIIKDMINKIDEINSVSKSKKTNILYLAPHLSTGGMPAFLLKRIEAIKKYYSNEFNIFVIEYTNYGDIFSVQKDIIKTMIDTDKFYSLGYLGDSIDKKYQLLDIINYNNIDIIHIDEIIEGFDSFNSVPRDLISLLYNEDRSWKIVETCHNTTFNPKQSKVFHPDAYALCSKYHKNVSFADEKEILELIEYPIENFKKTKAEKLKAQLALNLNPEVKHIINVGIWTPGKNQKEFVEIARLFENDNNLHFHSIGGLASNFEDYWKPIIENLPKNITVWGERHDVHAFMAASDVLLFNSTFECNPITLKEAISFGLKILARNLDVYLDTYSQYIIPINGNILDTKNKLEKIIDSKFYTNTISDELYSFAEKNANLYLNLKNKKSDDKIEIIQHFVGQPYFEIKGISDNSYLVEFFDENKNVVYSENIRENTWIKLNRKYYTKWITNVYKDEKVIYSNMLSLKNKRVYISFDSSSLGDTIAWIPYCLEFKKKHNCYLIVSTFWNKLFVESYPDIEFVTPGDIVYDLYAMYNIGYYYDDNSSPENPQTIPLQKVATNILGLNYNEKPPMIEFKPKKRPIDSKYITIATESTAQLKYWNYPKGWEILCEYLQNCGYKVVSVSKEPSKINGVINLSDNSIENTINVIHHSEFLIGLSSGLSWLAWALNKHVVMIANFTDEDQEFKSNCTRITNKSVCNSCWNNPLFKFDKSDWNWCPEHKNTPRQFECHKSITPEMVFKRIKKDIFKNEN